MKTELIMLAVWSAVMLQSGVLPTSYITNVKNENVQEYLTQQEAHDIFLPFFSEQDLSENETSLLTSTGETELDEELLEEAGAKHQETTENVDSVSEQNDLNVETKEMEPIVSDVVQEQGQEEEELQTVETVEKEELPEDAEQEELQEGEEKSSSEADSGEEPKVEENLQGDEEIAEKQEETEQEQEEAVDTEAESGVTEAHKASEIGKKLEQSEAEREAERKAKREQIEAERKAREEAERIAREEAEKAEAERIAKEEAEKAEAERIAKEEAEKAEAERIAKEEAEKAEAERKAKEEAEKAEAERKAKEEAEARKLNTDPNTLTFLVNKEHALPADYVPKLVEPQVNHCQPTGSHKRYMRAEAAAALEEMFAAAKADGYDLWVKTAYRSYKNQYDTYTWMLQYRGVQEAVYYHAIPGTSEHQTGLAVDIVCEASKYENDLSFERTKEYTWLKDNCYKYGFTLRYLKGMEHITGYNYEPWHYRYVGVELATYLMENNLTLEEYYQALPTTDLFQVPEEYRHLIQDKTESN